MPVYEVKATYLPNGNSKSRPIVAATDDDAQLIAEAEWDIAPNDPNFRWSIDQRIDEDGRLEQLLVDAEKRRLEAEFYRW